MFGDQTFSRLGTFFDRDALIVFERHQTVDQILQKKKKKHFAHSNMFDIVSPLNTTSKCLITKECLIMFGRQTFPVWTGLKRVTSFECPCKVREVKSSNLRSQHCEINLVYCFCLQRSGVLSGNNTALHRH